MRPSEEKQYRQTEGLMRDESMHESMFMLLSNKNWSQISEPDRAIFKGLSKEQKFNQILGFYFGVGALGGLMYSINRVRAGAIGGGAILRYLFILTPFAVGISYRKHVTSLEMKKIYSKYNFATNSEAKNILKTALYQ